MAMATGQSRLGSPTKEQNIKQRITSSSEKMAAAAEQHMNSEVSFSFEEAIRNIVPGTTDEDILFMRQNKNCRIAWAKFVVKLIELGADKFNAQMKLIPRDIQNQIEQVINPISADLEAAPIALARFILTPVEAYFPLLHCLSITIEKDEIYGCSVFQIIEKIMKGRVDVFKQREDALELCAPDRIIEFLRCLQIDFTDPITQPLFVMLLQRYDIGYSVFSIVYLWLNSFHRNVIIPDTQQCPLLGDDIARQTSATTSHTTQNGSVINVSTSVLPRGIHLGSCQASILDTSVTLTNLSDLEGGKYRLYHGTDLVAATEIVENGIDFAKGSTHSDFGQGFYATPDLSCALSYAILTANSTHGIPVIIELHVDETYLGQNQSLNGENWAAVVSAFRRGPFPSDLRNVRSSPVLSGRISANGGRIDLGQNPIPSDLVQHCFKTDDATDNICLKSVVRFHT